MSNFIEQVNKTNIYLQPIQFVLSISLNLISIRILSSRYLRRSSCTYYLLAYATFSIIYMIQSCPRQFLLSYNIVLEANNILCKLFRFILLLLPTLSRVMLLLASFDRFCSSSNLIRLNAQNTAQKAKRNLMIITIVTTISMLPNSIVHYWNETYQICQTHNNLSALMFLFAETCFLNIFSPLLMIIFGYLTIYNIRQNILRVRVERILQSNRRTEGQLARMLILQITVHIITAVPYGTIFLINAIYPSNLTPFMIAIRNIIILTVQSQFYISFFIYIISGQIYRQEFIKIIKKTRLSCL